MDKSMRIFHGDNLQDKTRLEKLPAPPPWREFRNKQNRQVRGETYLASDKEVDMVNAALYLRRPLLMTGRPGTGKTSLAHAVAHELALDDVLIWPITSKSILQHGLYTYDAIGRLQEASRLKSIQSEPEHQDKMEDIGRFLRLGPVGTAFLKSKPDRPAVLLVDEIDKSDIDLPNDLLHLFEEGEFEIPELARQAQDNITGESVFVAAHGSQEKLGVPRNGVVRCQAFPLVIMTSNGEREFPPAFLRRCLRIHLEPPSTDKVADIVKAHLQMTSEDPEVKGIIDSFLDLRDKRQKKLPPTNSSMPSIY